MGRDLAGFSVDIPTIGSSSGFHFVESRGGSGGNIGLNASKIILTNKAAISGGTNYKKVIIEGDEGSGGSIGIIADKLDIDHGSEITVGTSGTGPGGSILIGDYDLINNYNDQQKIEGNTGPFDVFLDGVIENGITKTKKVVLANSSAIISESTYDPDAVHFDAPGAEAGAAGAAGDIKIRATDSIHLQYNSQLTTMSKNAGGGSIDIQAKNKLWLLNSWIETSSESDDRTDKGGNITIDPIFVVLQNNAPYTLGEFGNYSRITANANFGDGGNINITTQYLIGNQNHITATSNKGINGQINIQTLDFDVSGALSNLNVNLLDATKWRKTPCRLRTGASVSRLILKGKDAVPTAHDDFLSGLPAILSDPDFFKEDGNPDRVGFVNPKVFEEQEDSEEEECEDCK